MQIVQEELFSKVELPVMYVIATNAIVKNNGALVMGAGAAKHVRDTYKNMDRECGETIQRASMYSPMMKSQTMYGFLEVRSWTRPNKAGFGIFQVKRHYKDKADIALINYSCQTLVQWMSQNELKCPIRMNFPGIGNGQLPHDIVEPILWAHMRDMPVTICVK